VTQSFKLPLDGWTPLQEESFKLPLTQKKGDYCGSIKQTIYFVLVRAGINFTKLRLIHSTFRHAYAPFAGHAESELQKHMNYASKPTSGLLITSNQLHTKISLENTKTVRTMPLVHQGPETTTC